MMAKRNQAGSRRARRQRGIALMIALFALVVIALMGAAVLSVTINGSIFGRQAAGLERAATAAQAGADEARGLLRGQMVGGVQQTSPVVATLCSNSNPAPGLAPTCSTNTVVYIVNPSSDYPNPQPWLSSDKYPDPTFTTEPSPFGGTVASGFVTPLGSDVITSSLTNVTGFKWARINVETENSADQVVDGSNPALATQEMLYDAVPTAAGVIPGRYPNGSSLGSGSTDPAVIFQITAMGVSGGYEKLVTEDVTRFPFAFQAPSAVTLSGSSPLFGGPHSNNFTVSGVDASGVYPTLPALAVAVPGNGAAAVNSVNSGIPSVRDDCAHYGPCPVSSNGGPVIANVSSTQTAGCISQSSCNPLPLSSDWNTEGTFMPPTGLLGLVNQLENSADVVCSGSGTVATGTTAPAACPSSAGNGTGFLDGNNPGLTVIEGNYTLPTSGGGTLLITGDATIPPNFTWNGLLLFIGSGHTMAGGNGTPTINGAVFAANVCGNLGATDPTGEDIGLQNCSQIGNADFNIAVGGGNSSGGIRFDSAMINAANQNRTYAVLSYREQTINQ
jgi:hypothetical protein